MSFLDYNLNLLSGIRSTNKSRADKKYAERARKSGMMYDVFKDIGDKYYQSVKAQKLADAKKEYDDRYFTEMGLNRQSDMEMELQREKFQKETADQMRQNYENGSYTNPITKVTYHWETPEQFRLAEKAMQEAMDIYYSTHYGAGSKAKDSRNLDGVFFNILSDLAATTFKNHFDPTLKDFDEQWITGNTDDFRKAFENKLYNYTDEEKKYLRLQLEDYLGQRQYTEPDIPDDSSSVSGDRRPFGQWASDTLYNFSKIGNGDKSQQVDAYGNIVPSDDTFGFTKATTDDVTMRFFDVINKVKNDKKEMGVPDNLLTEVKGKLTSLPEDLPENIKNEVIDKVDNARGLSFNKKKKYIALSQYLDQILATFSNVNEGQHFNH